MAKKKIDRFTQAGEEATDIATQALALEVVSDAQAMAADELFGAVVDVRSRAKAIMEPFVKDVRLAYESVRARRDAYLTPCEDALTHLRAQLAAWHDAHVEGAMVPSDGDFEGVAHVAPTLQHITFPETYKPTVVDKMALILAVANGEVPMVALDVNTSYLNKRATAERAECRIPGVVVERITNTRAKPQR